jgi:L-arabinose isomerase
MELTFATWTKNPGGALRLLTGRLDCVSHPVFKELGAPHFVVQPGRKLDEFLTEYSMNGGGHHLYVAQGDQKREMEMFASLIGVDFCFME